MATGSPFMGTLKGKLGETVALRRNGKQVLRAYVRDIKNPNSQKQQVQRMVQATAAQAYSAMKKICDHSFEGVQVGQKSMSYFISKNMDKLRAAITAGVDGTLVSATADYVRKGVNLPVLNEYVVAKGTLPEVSLGDSAVADVTGTNAFNYLYLGNFTSSRPENILQEFVLANNGQVGDWFTFCFLIRQNGVEVNGQTVYRFAFVRFVVEEKPINVYKFLLLTPSLTSVGVPSVVWSDAFEVVQGLVENKDTLALNLLEFFPNLADENDKGAVCAYAVIHSRQNVGGSWQRSNAVFVVRKAWETLNITWPDDFFDELATYAGSAEAKGLGDYVLNGGD